MKIGFFSSKFPYHDNGLTRYYPYGGSVIASYYLIEELVKKGINVDVFTNSSNSSDSIEINNNLRVMRYGINSNLLTSSISIGLFHKPFDYDVDIAHVSFDIPPSPIAGLKYAQRKGIPLVLTYHGDWDSSYGSLFRRMAIYLINKHYVDKILSCAKIIISPSRLYIDSSNFLYKYRDKIRLIHNGIDLSTFDINFSKEESRSILNLPMDANIILFFGNLSPYKSPDIILRALPTILEEYPNTILVMAGTGVMVETLRNLSTNLGVDKNVVFTGFVEEKLKPLYYKSADIFCLPSTMRTECYPLAILESMACSTMVVASNIGGIPEIIDDGKNGILVNPGSIMDLAQSLVHLLDNPSLMRKMGASSRKKVEQYTWQKIAEETEKIYSELLN